MADIGAGTGLLGLMAAQLGAREVFLYEVGEIAGVAERAIERSGFRNCHLMPCHSMEMQDPPKVDLIVNTGDNLGHRDGLVGIRRAFAPLAGIPGVFVHGSNDVQAPSPRNPLKYFGGPSKNAHHAELLDTDAMDDFFTAELGWHALNNAAARLDVAGNTVDFFGVDDAHRDWDELDVLPDALAALGARPSDASVLGVTHAPYQRVLNEFVDLGADAVFGGHTHGGQVCLPGYGAIVANCDIPMKQAKGLSTWSHGGRTIPLNVSAGCGHSIYAPVRFACRPEATLLTLTARSV